MSTWIMEPGHTEVEFRARHMMVTWVRKLFKDIHGTLDFEWDKPLDDFFGELALLDPAARRNATVIGLEPAETLVLTGERFSELRRANPSVNRVLTEGLRHGSYG